MGPFLAVGPVRVTLPRAVVKQIAARISLMVLLLAWRPMGLSRRGFNPEIVDAGNQKEAEGGLFFGIGGECVFIFSARRLSREGLARQTVSKRS